MGGRDQMTREQQIVETFVSIADTTGEGFDAVDLLHRVGAGCVKILACTEAGVLLADSAGRLTVMGSTNEQSDALELLQSQSEQGPCIDCYQRGEPVTSSDIAADHRRWPIFVPAAMRKGFAAVHSFPMRVGDRTIGAINLFHVETGPLTAPDQLLAQGIADVAAVSLVQAQTAHESAATTRQLQQALSSRVVIEQAKGLLAARAQIDVDLAFERLRAHARNENRRLHAVAKDLIDGQLDPSAVTATPDRANE